MALVSLKGGLGNQLFQFAFGYSNFRSCTNILTLDVSAYDMPKSRSLDFQKILKPNAIEFTFKKQNKINRFVNKVLSKIGGTSSTYILGCKIYQKIREPHFHYCQEIINNKSSNAIYEGYWQSWRYFDQSDTGFIGIFDLSLPASGIAKKSAKIIQTSNKPTCSIHIRRGDYTDPEFAGVYELLDMDYYNDAMNIMRKSLPGIQFYVFSDSPKEAKKLFDQFDDCDFLPAESALDDFYLMHLCDHNIIGNSTFSWWAAWFNNNSHKQVIAPSRWFANEAAISNNTEDLYMPDWTIV